MHSVPSAEVSGPSLEQIEERLETGDDLEKTGRPEWLRKLELAAPHHRRFFSGAGVVGVALLLFALFYFSLGSHESDSVDDEMQEEPMHVSVPSAKVDLASASISTPTSKLELATSTDPSATVPTYIGWPGEFTTGAPADNAEDMHPATPSRGSSPIQTAVPGYDSKFNPLCVHAFCTR